MSEKADCPGCGAYSSSIPRAMYSDEPCSFCGLSAAAIREVLQVRERTANAELTEKYTAAVVARDKAETKVRKLEDALDTIRGALEELDRQ